MLVQMLKRGCHCKADGAVSSVFTLDGNYISDILDWKPWRSCFSGKSLCSNCSESCRIVVTSLMGKFIDQIGGNGSLLRDGTFKEAALNRPQGLAYSSLADALFVADTENHALRKVKTAYFRHL